MESISAAKTTIKAATSQSFFSKVLSGTSLIAGTTIGAGMLGIPLLTAKAGFYPALLITGLVWVFMLATGLALIEATLWMPNGSNVLTMAGRLLGGKGRFFAGSLFLFLYYCLLVAYIAGGAPIFTSMTHLPLSGPLASIIFAGLFGAIVFRGVRSIDRVNLLLMFGLVLSYVIMVGLGTSAVSTERFFFLDLPAAFGAAPVLFSAFGYHNMIPSLCSYLERDAKALKLSVIFGTSIAFLVYVVWQWLVIGSVPLDAIAAAKAAGKPASAVLQGVVQHPWLGRCADAFAFFALVTSFLGVALSMVDFIHDGLQKYRLKRIVPTLLAFLPPLGIVLIDPTIFDRALGIAGGFGEAFLNGLLPVLLLWMGRYKFQLEGQKILPGGKMMLWTLALCSLGVCLLEIFALLN